MMNSGWIPKNKSLRLALLTMFLSVLLYIAGVFIASREARKVEDFYRDSESEFSKNERLLAIKSLAIANQESIEALRSFLVKKGEEASFIGQLEQTAKDSSVKIDIISIDDRLNPSDTFKQDINVKMTVSGSWEDVIRFVGRLEKMPFGVLLQGTSLNTDGGGEWDGFVELTAFREK